MSTTEPSVIPGAVFRSRFRASLPLRRALLEPAMWIDLVLLSAILIVGTSSYFPRGGIAVSLPSVDQASSIPLGCEVIIVTAADRLYLANMEVDRSRLEEKIAEIVTRRSDAAFAIEADEGVRYSLLTDVISACRKAGVAKIYFTTRLSRSGVR